MSHMFWNAPARQGSYHGPFRTIPLRMGGRHLGLQAGPFMGQEAQNRLYSVLIPSIVARALLAPVVQEYFEKQRNPPRGRGVPADLSIAGTPPTFPPMSDADRSILLSIMADPTSGELEDLAIIDKFYNSAFAGGGQQYAREKVVTTFDLCHAIRNPGARLGLRISQPQVDGLTHYLTYRPVASGRWARPSTDPIKGEELLKDSFFCPAPADIPAPPHGNYLTWFTANPQATWGADKVHVKNALTLMKEMGSFPFPPPITPLYFWTDPRTQAEIAQMSGYDLPLDPEAVRYWITLAVLERYNDIVDRMQSDAKRAAKKAKRRALIRIIASVVIGIVAAIVLPAAIVAIGSAIKTAIDMKTQYEERKKAAKAIAEAAKLFEKDAPAFAAEAEKTAKFVDSLSAEEALAAPLTPEMEAAILEDPTPTSASDLLIPGAIAAAAAGAAALLL